MKQTNGNEDGEERSVTPGYAIECRPDIRHQQRFRAVDRRAIAAEAQPLEDDGNAILVPGRKRCKSQLCRRPDPLRPVDAVGGRGEREQRRVQGRITIERAHLDPQTATGAAPLFG